MIKSFTVFNTPIIRHFFFAISWLGLKLTGWKVKGMPPAHKRYVMIAVPHTSNWDFCITLAMAFVARANIHWVGKQSLFAFPFGGFMRWCGGIGIDRSKRENVVEKLVDLFKKNNEFILTIAPEGTRAKVKQWKSGFYHIAHNAKVPLVLGFLNHNRKEGGFGPSFVTSGDFKKDLAAIVQIYQELIGDFAKHLPQQAAE